MRPLQWAGYTGCFNYDAFGNRKVYAYLPSATNCNGEPSSTASYNSSNQATSVSQSSPSPVSATFSYDAAGNVTYDGQNDYAYDGEGRLCAAYNILLTRLTDYVYDADGLRVAKGSVGGLSTPSSPMNRLKPLYPSSVTLVPHDTHRHRLQAA